LSAHRNRVRTIELTNAQRRKLAMAAAEYDTSVQQVISTLIDGFIAGLTDRNPKLRKMYKIVDREEPAQLSQVVRVDPNELALLS
jgi:hypothetical protein